MQIVELKILDNYRLWLKFNDGSEGEIDLSDYLNKGVFTKWKDVNFFKSVEIGESGELNWNNEIDLCPDSLYMKISGKTPEELFPSLNKETTSA